MSEAQLGLRVKSLHLGGVWWLGPNRQSLLATLDKDSVTLDAGGVRGDVSLEDCMGVDLRTGREVEEIAHVDDEGMVFQVKLTQQCQDGVLSI